ncbi:hypothetical protein SELMODRAFT_96490 [Selaginella moellendorffii]|uniref:Vacuolar protein sorting-associated protein 28 homolog n=1 Tax=Selaginella moellendorffii TaxID=88036 RepID=D8RLH9_SELML|nr:vacuolar protein sorting-associated protein 28 homolog 1 [Selaginella moellendorffii]XP_002972536.1 vacuolar protein sorting-associated protein 28 homolog 1 [Selaginella moellendorffii]EFJ26622.1 hypothetical protein SELMODRAFT_97782 [Selaginella moellendorffii]EFJ26919.1 hypothetical protein SELMODRAFT_96490 [Selaginella moellendorffii]|eukprot:XP_002972002.1 vacuolar protein sorting-associated protein 28 homolog 1 [Selaginella moellendorffii]
MAYPLHPQQQQQHQLQHHQHQQEVKLWSDKREREMFENFADLFAIIKTTEKLEKAYVRDAMSARDYEPWCTKLIAQFRTLKNALRDVVPDVDRFMAAYKMDCPAAHNRLLVSGIPATVEHKSATSSSFDAGATAVAVAECVQHYITAMDSLKLNMVAVDQIHPLLLDLLSALNRVPQLTADFEGKVKTRDWIAKLNKMGASDELTEQQARQLLFDLDSSYNAFINSLPKHT